MDISFEITSFQLPKGSCTLKATTSPAQIERVGEVAGEVLHHGASEQDNPVTWEILSVPRDAR